MDGHPDGICLDAEDAVWYADVPNKRCVRVYEGGKVVQTIDLDARTGPRDAGTAERREKGEHNAAPRTYGR